MEKILVATDLSVNSTSSIHFAFNLARLKGATLIIAHVYHIIKPKSWRPHRFENYHAKRREFLLEKMENLIDRALSNSDRSIEHMEVDLIMHSNTVNALIKCAARHKCTHVCISTHGNGKNKNNLGLTATKLIAKMPIPIFSIPKAYKIKNIVSICYVSDLTNYQKEISKLVHYLNLFHAELLILHIKQRNETIIRSSLLQTRILKRIGISIKVKYANRTSTDSLIVDMNKAIKKLRPSLVVLFLNRSTHYLNSIHYTAEAPSLSFLKKMPVLALKR